MSVNGFNDAMLNAALAQVAIGAVEGYIVKSGNNALALSEANQAALDWTYNTGEMTDQESPLVKTQNTPWRPQEWNDSQLVYAKTSVAGYFFDAILKADHTTTLRATEHPVQNGASIVDHAYMLPARLTLEIGMSDCMDQFVNGQFSSNMSKSVSAYQILLQLQSDRQPMDIVTRLNDYSNMIIESIHAPDDVKTRDGLRCTVMFREIMMADVATVLASARPQASTAPAATTVQPTIPSGSILGAMEEKINGHGHGASGNS